MSDSLAAGNNDLTRKRSRSSSPSHDSAAKKANQAAAAPVSLERDDDDGDDDGAAAAAAATADDPPSNGDNPAPATETGSTGVAPMNVDSSGIPAKPVGAEVAASSAAASSADAQQAQSPAAQTITMRTLIVTQDASVIIGKQGKNINEIRDKSGSKLNITESVAGNPERIMSVSGPLDAVSKVSCSLGLGSSGAQGSDAKATLDRPLVSSSAGSTTSRSTSLPSPAREPSPSGAHAFSA